MASDIPDGDICTRVGNVCVNCDELWPCRVRLQATTARLQALLAERDARIKTLENDLEHALASVGAFRQAVENVFAKAEEHEVDQGGMIVTYVLPCGPLHRAIGLTRGTDAGGKLLKRLGDTEAERDDLAARMAAAEAAIREALYDYDHGDDLGAIDRLRAALAAQEGRDDLPTE